MMVPNATDGPQMILDSPRYKRISKVHLVRPSSRHSDTQTVLMARFDGTNGATTFEDDATITQDIRFSGGAQRRIPLVHYTDFGAEIRSIGSASVYGNFGLFGDGP